MSPDLHPESSICLGSDPGFLVAIKVAIKLGDGGVARDGQHGVGWGSGVIHPSFLERSHCDKQDRLFHGVPYSGRTGLLPRCGYVNACMRGLF